MKAGAPGPCGPGHSSRGSPGREPGRARCSRVLAFRRRSLRNACPRPMARLASLHRRSPRRLRRPAMALLDFRPSRLLEVPADAPAVSVDSGSSSWESSATAFAGSAEPAPRSPSGSAMAGLPFRARPRPGGYRFPGPRPSCGYVARVLQHAASLRFRASFPDREVHEDLKILAGALVGFAL